VAATANCNCRQAAAAAPAQQLCYSRSYVAAPGPLHQEDFPHICQSLLQLPAAQLSAIACLLARATNEVTAGGTCGCQPAQICM
jgi:hypothetical protein